MMYSTIIFLWSSLAVLIFTRTVAFPMDVDKILNSHPGQINARPIWLFSTNSNGFVRVKGSHVDSLGLKDDESAMLQLESSRFKGSVVVRIRSVKENRYLCVNSDGNLTVEVHGNIMNRCLFSEGFDSGFTTFQSKHNTNWFLGFKRNGRVKQPHNTTDSQKAARFLTYYKL